jgi:hypothetical protein
MHLLKTFENHPGWDRNRQVSEPSPRERCNHREQSPTDSQPPFQGLSQKKDWGDPVGKVLLPHRHPVLVPASPAPAREKGSHL